MPEPAGLEVARLSVAYGKHQALADVALTVAPGEIVTILGANGAGKTTLLEAIAGIVTALPGAAIRLGGRDIGALPPHRIVEAGIALVPEGRGIFGELTVRENLLLGADPLRARAGEREASARVLRLFARLAERLGQRVRTMSGGEQQMMALGRALMSAPAILLLDEPSLGLSPLLCSEVFRALVQVRSSGVAMLLVEQNAKQSLAAADRGTVIANGRIVAAGTAAELRRDPAIRRAYLGAGDAA